MTYFLLSKISNSIDFITIKMNFKFFRFSLEFQHMFAAAKKIKPIGD